MKRIVPLILGTVVGVGITVGATVLVVNHFHNGEIEQLGAQIATLNATLESIGEITTCYTVQAQTFPGQEITEDLLVAQSIPSSFTNESFASKEEMVGLYSKVAISPGTPITKDLLMSEEIINSTREVDITGNRWPIGLKEGDYVDLRLTYPLGEDFIVLSHKRVMSITDQTLKVHMTEEEQTLYQASLVDFYLSRQQGADMYLTKYVEPGLQEPAKTYYSIPLNIAIVVQQNPNIVDKALVALQQDLRNTIEQSQNPFSQDETEKAGYISAGRNELNSKVNSDYRVWNVEDAKGESAGSDDKPSSLITDVTLGVN